MKEKIIKIILPVFLFAGLFFSCTTTKEVLKRAPSWVTDPPADTLTSVFFVGTGSDTADNLASAEERAGNSLIEAISRFIGVSVTAETTITARDTLKNYEEEIREVITQSSSARLTDFKVVDKWINIRGGETVVYLLGKYDKARLLSEKQRIKELFQEKLEAVSGPEREGDNLLGEGKIYQAALKYLEAAAAAANSDIDNSQIKFKRNVDKARGAISRIELFPLTNNLETTAGLSFSVPFSLKVTNRETGQGIQGASVYVVYKEPGKNSGVLVKTISGQTDSQGVFSFNHPAVSVAGDDSLTMALDFRSSLAPLEDMTGTLTDYIDGLKILINGKKARFFYSVISRARNIATGIYILDLDGAGNLRSENETAAGVQESLTKAGFTLLPIPDLQRGELVSDSELIDYIKKKYGDQIERIIFGTVRISDFAENDGNYLVKVSGTIKVADLESGRILYSDSPSKRSRGGNTVTAISAAFKGLGQETGAVLASKMP